MAGEGMKREKCELFDLPPRKRFKLLEEQRREKEMELQTRDSCCNDITNYSSHGVSSKKLALQRPLVLEKENRNRQEQRLKRSSVQAMPPLPPRPVAVKRKDPPSLHMPITERSTVARLKLKSPASSAFKSWGDRPLNGSFNEITGILKAQQPFNVSSGSSQLISESSEGIFRRSVCRQPDVSRKEYLATPSKTPSSWMMSKGTKCSTNKAQEDIYMTVYESPSSSSDTSDSEEDMTDKVMESVSMNTTSFSPVTPVSLKGSIIKRKDTHQLEREIHEGSLVDEELVEASQTIFTSTSGDMMMDSTISAPIDQGESARGIDSETEFLTEAGAKPVDAGQSVCVDTTNSVVSNNKTSIPSTHVSVLLAEDGDKNHPSLDTGAAIRTTLPTMANGQTLSILVDGYEPNVEKVDMEKSCNTRKKYLKAYTIGSVIGEPDASSLTASSCIAARVEKQLSTGTSSNSKSLEGGIVTTSHAEDKLGEKSDSGCPAKQQGKQTLQVALDASDGSNGRVQEGKHRQAVTTLVDPLAINEGEWIPVTDSPQSSLTGREGLLVDMDRRVELLFKRMLERESCKGFDVDQGRINSSSDFLLPFCEMENPNSMVVDGEKLIDVSTSKLQDLRQIPIFRNEKVINATNADNRQVDKPRSISNRVTQFQNSSYALPVSSCQASQGDEVFPCSEGLETDSPNPADLGTPTFKLQEQPNELLCKSSKEDNGWDWDMEVPDFSFSMRSGMTQRVKALGRWSGRSIVETTSAYEDEDGEGACDVCRSADGTPSNPLVYCDGCNVAVHANCYGNPLHHEVPEGDWFCAQCKSRCPGPRSCCLCPRSGGAMKLTTDGNWAHLSCAIYVPEVFYRQPDDLERIDTSHVPSKRWLSTCSVCNSTGGACIDCTEIGCSLRFHVSCALRKNLALEFRDGRNGAIVISFCEEHTAAWDEQQESGKGRSKYKIVSRESKKLKTPLRFKPR